MTDYDAAAALLMLSAGFRATEDRTVESNNNFRPIVKLEQQQVPAGARPLPAPNTVPVNFTLPKVRSTPTPATKLAACTEDVIRQQIWQKTLRAVPNGAEEEAPPKEVTFRPENRSLSSPKLEAESSAAQGGQSAIHVASQYVVRRYGSSSPDLHRWDSSRTSSPIVPSSSGGLPSPPSTHDSYEDLRGRSTMYDSPGMNGFALRLNKAVGRGYVSSPEPAHVPAPAILENELRKQRRGYNALPGSSCTGPNGEEKSLNSPTDSGVSSIHDEILQPNLIVQRWSKGSNVGEGLPPSVRMELDKIIEISAYNKDFYTKTKMEKFPVEMTFNPNKSRMRKECTNAVDNLDREKNNAASRRSRHKKKMLTHMMNISLEYDRNENRQLHLQDCWLTNMIFELEEKALNLGTESHVLRRLRADCGFQ